MIVVVDTNVFVSGIFWQGNYCSQIIDKWIKKEISLVVSVKIIDELIDTLSDFKIKMPEKLIQNWRDELLSNSVVVEPSKKLEVVKDDPDDDKFIEAAVEGKCKYIISQDKHLLKIRNYNGIKILRPEEFLELIK